MNYGGFGQRRDPSNSGDSRQPESASPSAFGGSKFGGFKMPGASTVYGNKANFNPLDQFRSSMLSILNAGLKPAEDYERIYRNSILKAPSLIRLILCALLEHRLLEKYKCSILGEFFFALVQKPIS